MAFFSGRSDDERYFPEDEVYAFEIDRFYLPELRKGLSCLMNTVEDLKGRDVENFCLTHLGCVTLTFAVACSLRNLVLVRNLMN